MTTEIKTYNVTSDFTIMGILLKEGNTQRLPVAQAEEYLEHLEEII